MIRNGMSHAQAGREGGHTRHAIWQAKRRERYAHLDRDHAIDQAWKDGREAGKAAEARGRRRKPSASGYDLGAVGRAHVKHGWGR